MSDSVMIQRGDGSKSPVHIHLEDTSSPVHVHVQKQKKSRQSTSTTTDFTLNDEGRLSSGNMRRSTVTHRPTSRGPGSKNPGNHWKSSLKTRPPGMKYCWQGPSHRLDIALPAAGAGGELDENREHLSDVETDQNIKLDQLRKTKSLEMAKKDELLETSFRVLREQEDELEVARRKREAAELENQRLRHHMDSLCSDLGISRTDGEFREMLACESLLKKLVEAEVDGQAIADKAAGFTDAIQRLREDKRLTSADSATILSKHLNQLADSVAQFAVTNSALRCMLRDQHDQELNAMRLSEHRDALLAKLARSQDSIQILKSDLLEKDRTVADLQLQLNAQKDENVTISSLQSSLNTTRAHLQKQLRQKDGDCNRLAVQIRTLESQLAQERIEVDHLRSLLQRAREKTDEDKEQLKRATRVQKLRATKSKDELEQLQSQIIDREAVIADQRVEIDTVRAQYSKLGREKSQSDAELTALKIRVDELENVLERMEDDSKQHATQLSSKVHEKSTEAASLRLENERLKSAVTSLESKLSLSDADMLQLRSNLREYETLIDDYRKQLNQSRRELDDSFCQLEEQKHQTHRLRQDGERELDTVRSQLESRLLELEQLPELLNSMELKLRDASELLREYEKRHIENVRHIGDLTDKVNDLTGKLDTQTTQLSEAREKGLQATDENRAINVKLELLERKLASLEEQNRELISINAKKEEALQQTTIRLEEKSSENASLQRQLDSAITDIRRHKDVEREQISITERTLQARMIDLESQLSQARAEVSRQKREKNEIERSLNSRLEDLKSRLEASHSTNRTMQNYVHFLKSAYATAFNDSTLALNISPPRTTPF